MAQENQDKTREGRTQGAGRRARLRTQGVAKGRPEMRHIVTEPIRLPKFQPAVTQVQNSDRQRPRSEREQRLVMLDEHSSICSGLRGNGHESWVSIGADLVQADLLIFQLLLNAISRLIDKSLAR